MTTYKEIKEKVEKVTKALQERSPKEWHDKIRELIELTAEKNEFFFIIGQTEVQIENTYKELLPYMIYDMEWSVGDTLIGESGKRYIVAYDNSDEPVNKRYGLFDLEKFYFIKRSGSVAHLQQHLKSFSTFPTAIKIVDIEKKGKETVANV